MNLNEVNLTTTLATSATQPPSHLSKMLETSQMDRTRNKYNTLTPSEAKKLNRFMVNHRRAPIRTASVLHKPKAPPISVNNLDNDDHLEASIGLPAVMQTSSSQDSSRCASAMSERFPDRRHSVNYGRAMTLSNRIYASSRTVTRAYSNRCSRQASPEDSGSNISYRSSLDVTDSVFAGSVRLQTMSVDLGKPDRDSAQLYGTLRNQHNVRASSIVNDYCQSNKISDDSYTSARSDIGSEHGSITPIKLQSASKTSLSASTYKVLQSPFANFKKFIRNMPRAFTNSNEPVKRSLETSYNNGNSTSALEESISQLCLNRSQSPPVCPPPPKELKSMCYMENAMNYSNYDEFTKARNKKINGMAQNRCNSNIYSIQPTTLKTATSNYNSRASQQNDESDSWQLTSLPVAYERNLSTVLEERYYPVETIKVDKASDGLRLCSRETNLIKPPVRFDDDISESTQDIAKRKTYHSSRTDSSQSLASTTTTDSVLDFHSQPATPYRFSFGQPNSSQIEVNIQKNAGLPPRMPLGATATSSDSKQDTSSGNSSNSSSQLNAGLDNDADTTIISETSTIRGESSVHMYANKCAELERVVTSLKNKLIMKEKELTDLQLSQLHNDYTIDRLKSQVSKLERENAHLRSLVIKNNNNCTFSSRANL